MFKVVDKTDNNFDTADNNKNYGSWCFIFVFAEWSLLSNMSLFLMFEVVNKTDGDFDTADNDYGDEDKNKSVNNQDNSVKGVETNWHISTNNELTTADPFLVFFGVVNANLPTITILRGDLLLFAMVATKDEILFIQPEK